MFVVSVCDSQILSRLRRPRTELQFKIFQTSLFFLPSCLTYSHIDTVSDESAMLSYPFNVFCVALII